MRVVLITGDGLGHHYVANRLASEVELAGIVVDEGTGSQGRARKLWKRYTIPQLVSRTCLRILARVRNDNIHAQHRLLEILTPEKSGDFLFPGLVTRVHGVNSAESVRVVTSLQPDVILVFGTSVVKKPILSLASRLALNLHTGISPYYRGAECAFWPLYNEELHMLGATVHECTMELDGGRIFGVKHASLEAHDDLESVMARCIVAGADLYVEMVKQLIAAGTLEGSPQDLTIGREYKAVMRNVRADLKVRLRIRNGLIRRYVAAQRPRSAAAK